MQERIQPTVGTARIASLDFLRGIAVLGIVFINIENFAYPDSWSPWKYGFQNGLDRSTRFWVYFLTQGKFATMFTLLFGVGFYLFLERLETKQLGLRAMDIYARRLLWLFLIGVFHAYFIWSGDVLYHYAICGLLLFPFRSFSQRGLLFTVLSLVVVQGGNAYLKTAKRVESYRSFLEVTDYEEDKRSDLENKRVAYWNDFLQEKEPDTSKVKIPKQTYLEGLSATFSEAKVHKGLLYYQGFLFPTLMVMILGVYLCRSGIFSDYRAWPYYWHFTVLLVIVGLVFNYFRYEHWTFHYFQPVLSYGKDWMFTFHKQILGVGYVLLLNGVYQRVLSHKGTPLISAIGRMALSNYIVQNLLMGWVFYGYGLAFFNQLSRSELLVVIVLIWSIQMIFSVLWMKKYRQGPIEWLWKKITYSFAEAGPIEGRTPPHSHVVKK